MTPTHVDGGTAVEMDVSEQLRNVQSTVATVRFRLEPPGVADGQRSFVNIATMETGSDENKPQLLISLPDVNAPTTPPKTVPPPPVVTTTAPPATAPPRTTTTTRPAPPVVPRPTPPPGGPSGWDLSFSDEFNGSNLDTVEVELRGEHVRRREQRDRMLAAGQPLGVGRNAQAHGAAAPDRLPVREPPRTSSRTGVRGPRPRSTAPASSHKPRAGTRSAPSCPTARASGPRSG